MAVADTTAANTAINTLVRGPGFYLVTTSDTTKFSVSISAAGNFAIEWGDGATESIVDKSTGATTYSHTYASSGSHKIRITSTATGYDSNRDISTIVFPDKINIASISGNLGKIFPTLSDGTNPSFYKLFEGATNLSGQIPPKLFDGIYGKIEWYMFARLFLNCSNLTGSIPADLFAGITGPLAQGTFELTFSGCSGLTGNIPSTLFSRINSETSDFIFNQTFRGCSKLTGNIPGNLFQGIYGAPKEAFFFGTFRDCKSLSGSIPGELFAGISGAPANSCFGETFQNCKFSGRIPEELFTGLKGAPADQMFTQTFASCTSLTGPSAKNSESQYLYDVFPDVKSDMNTYAGSTKLSDYDQIPDNWKQLNYTV